MNHKRFSLPLAAFLLGALILAVPQPTHATVVSAVICIGPEYPCTPADTIDSGFRANGVGLLGVNRWAALPFTFSDALLSFTGNIFVADSGAAIYSWGQGVAVETAAGQAFQGLNNLYLDVAITQNYVTAPGLWKFAEMNVGSCNAAATAGNDSSTVLGLVNGALMAPLPGVCSPFALGAGPYLANIGLITNLSAAAQFVFGPGPAGAAITLPWGDDLPFDQLNFDSSTIINDFITPDNIPAGFEDAAPEPATFSMIGGALCAAAFRFRKRKI